MRFQLSIIIIVFMLCVIATQSTSKYQRVSWNEKRNLWQVKFDINGKVRKFYFDNEVDAAKGLNQLCDKMGIPPQNPEICESPNQEKDEKKSQYKGVYWRKEKGKWHALIYLKGQRQKYGGTFEDQLDAAKRVNQMCEELGIAPQNPEISAIPNQKYQQKEKTSQYKGVYFNKQNGKWCVQFSVKEGRSKFGGYFKVELDAAKKVNDLCEELGISPKNPGIEKMSTQQSISIVQPKSKYNGVSWDNDRNLWQVEFYINGRKRNFYSDNEFDAVKQLNNLCNKMGIPAQNPEICEIPNQQKTEKTSHYKGVSLHRARGKWYVSVRQQGQKPKYGGYFKDELDAAKRANQVCEELGIPLLNPEISAKPNHQYQYQKKDKISQYKGVYWNRGNKIWYVQLWVKEGKSKYGGSFKNELNAAKRVNQLCEELGIPLRNPEISTIPNQPYISQNNCDFDAMQEEFESLIKILDEINDPTSNTIKENLITAINYGEQTVMTEINLPTKNGESALSIAAKYGVSNVVKFLISKGAEKEHFTNEHHTPLSLAVSQNHLKVVQVLFENWISPNSHEKPYLHLSPIFHVKSREIAQLLIENDAVTHKIYNDKNQSPLTVACQNGYLDVVECFLDDGLDINHLDSDNKTPLFYALTNKHSDVAKLLISKGAQN